MKKLIIIPAFNESESIEQTINEIIENAPTFDYIIINDCSNDNTKYICNKNNYNYIDLSINLGIGGAMQTGYKYAFENDYDIAVQIDGDGQHDPSYLNRMSEYLIENKLDMVIGSRFIDNEGFQSSGLRRLGIKYFTVLIKLLTKQQITDPTSGLRMANKKIIKLFCNDYPIDYPEPESIVVVLRKKFRIGEIPVIMKERSGGISSISPRKSIYYMIKVTLAIIIERIRQD